MQLHHALHSARQLRDAMTKLLEHYGWREAQSLLRGVEVFDGLLRVARSGHGVAHPVLPIRRELRHALHTSQMQQTG